VIGKESELGCVHDLHHCFSESNFGIEEVRIDTLNVNKQMLAGRQMIVIIVLFVIARILILKIILVGLNHKLGSLFIISVTEFIDITFSMSFIGIDASLLMLFLFVAIGIILQMHIGMPLRCCVHMAINL